MRIITLFSLAVLFMSCDCYIAQPTSIPVATPNRFLIIFNGESNSGGLVYDSLLSPSELAPQSQIQILNNTSFHFESLDIGTNNNLDHFNMPVGRHGWEANLANKVLSESSYYGDSVFLVKTGQGGSMLSEWDVNGIYFQKFKKRLDTAQYKLRDRNLKKVIFLSIGLNDIITGNTQPSVYKQRLIQHIANLRSIAGATTPVILTKFFAPYTNYDLTIDSVANYSGLTKIYSVDGNADRMDAVHWSIYGMPVIYDRMMAIVKTIYP